MLILLVGFAGSNSAKFNSQTARAAPAANVAAYELIAAMNTLRVSNGLPALIEDAIINAVAQSTAQTMADNQMSWHIGDVRGRLAAAGYGGGAQVWATENFATGNHTIDEIMVIWSDASHMIPAVNPAYCHVGAGVAQSSNGRNYYVLQAAYTATNSCGEYRSVTGNTPQAGGNPIIAGGVSQLIVPVKIATADPDGRIFHTVEAGQSFWAIAVAYKITIRDIETWNNLSSDAGLKIGQKLFIPGNNTVGYATPTPVGMVIRNEPGADGKIIHTVQPYQTLITIAQAYKVTVDVLLNLNNIQADWPLQIGQQLFIGSADSDPAGLALSPLQRLTPESDGAYYHNIKSGETISGIANLYAVSAADLMAWNNLNSTSIVYPNQKLLLLVTPPPTITPTPAPPVASATSAPVSPGHTSNTPPPSPAPSTSSAGPVSGGSLDLLPRLLMLGMAVGGLTLFLSIIRRKR